MKRIRQILILAALLLAPLLHAADVDTPEGERLRGSYGPYRANNRSSSAART